jgi:GMP synthase (glutamine-hydrolysing)
LGICYGHQLVAESLGGQVKPAIHGREMGATFIHHQHDDPLFKGLASPFQVWQTHIDEVALMPTSSQDLKITSIASNSHCKHQALAIGDRCRTVQWHPEMNQAIMSYYIDARQSVIDESWGMGAAEKLKQELPLYVESGSILIDNFFNVFV